MSRLWRVLLGAGLLVVLAGLAPFSASAQDEKTKGKDPEWKYGMNLRVRMAGVKDFTDKTHKFGIEAFKDENSGQLIYISDPAGIALVKANAKGGESKAPEWLHAMDLGVRKAGEKEFDKNTKKYGLEVFRDENSGNLIYICDSGSLAVVPGGGAAAPGATKKPEWRHGMELSVRKAGDKDFNKDTKKYGVEVFSDENNGNLVYITETGSIAVVTGTKKSEGDKVPDWKYGFEVSARKAGEGEFGKDTKRYNVEVFQDENYGNAIYVSETGSIAVLPGVKVPGGEKVKAPDWKYASDLAVRKAGQDKFTPETTKYGVEFYQDGNDGLMIAVTQTGSIAIMAGK